MGPEKSRPGGMISGDRIFLGVAWTCSLLPCDRRESSLADEIPREGNFDN